MAALVGSAVDPFGNVVTLQDAASLPAVHDFVEGFLASEARIANILARADADQSAMVQAACAALHLFAESGDAAANAAPFVARAQAAAPAATPREQRFVAAIAAWAAGDVRQAARLHEEQAREHPRDLASLKLGSYHLFNLGDAPGMLRLALLARDAASDVPYFHGLLAFGFEQCHLLREAEATARQAIALRRKEPWAHHALAHVMLAEGRLHEGLDSLRDYSDEWTGLNSFMQTHNWWHLALFALELGQHDEVLRLYDTEVWGVVKAYSQDQINAVSLLARLELAGVDVGNRWQDVGHYLAARTHDQVMPFLDLQYLYGLARAGRPEAELLLGQIEAHAQALSGTADAPVWQQVAVPAAEGLLAHAQGRPVEAAKSLGLALPRLAEIGGSHAQRDLFAQVHLDAMMRAGQWGGVQQLLQPQLRGQPESLRLRRLAREAYTALGLGSLLTAELASLAWS